MVFEWRCSCGHLNESDMDKWKKVRNGQGFLEECNCCEQKKEVDIEVKVN